jgi:hypothetical protein
MGCSNSSSDKNAVISPGPANHEPQVPKGVPEFDAYAINKYGFNLEIQQKIKEALGDYNLQLKIGYRYDHYSN